MTNDEFIAAIENLIAACQQSAACPKARDIWLDRVEGLESLIESESDPVILGANLRRSNPNDSRRY